MDFAELIDKYLRTNEAKLAFKLISRLSIIHPNKREGGVMNCLIDEENNLITGQDEINMSCL